MQTIGVTDITITYSRPGVKGRTIWGDPLPEQASAKGEATLDDQNVRPKGAPIVPWGHAWRTGANEATQFVVTDDVFINGQKLAAGSYSLHTIPTKDEFTIIFNSVANQWGSFGYDASQGHACGLRSSRSGVSTARSGWNTGLIRSATIQRRSTFAGRRCGFLLRSK